MIHLVCYSQSPSERAWFKDIFPPALSIKIFEKETELTDFLSSLKIPTQIIIDRASLQGDLQSFLMKNDFHHTICIQKDYTYEQCLQTLKYGAILVDPQQLSALQWWWNRTTIVSSKLKVEVLPLTGIIAAFSPSDRALEKNWPQIFKEYCAQSSQECLSMSVRHSHLHDPMLFEQLKKNWPTLTTLVLTDLEQIFPRDLRSLLAFMHEESKAHNLRIILDVQSSQVLFESLLDWSTTDSQQGLYKLQFNRTKMIHKTSFLGMTTICPHAMTLEYVRYTWLAGQNVS